MNYEIRKLNNVELPYNQLADLYAQTFTELYLENGALLWTEKYAKFLFQSVHQYRDLFYSAWIGDELIATAIGDPHPLNLDGVELKSITLALCATKPKYQRNGIQKDLISKLIEDAKKLGFDLVYAIPIKGFGGCRLLKNYFNFVNKNRNAKHINKVLGAYGVYCLKEYKQMGPIANKLAEVLYSKLPKDKLIGGGIIRDGDINKDLSDIVELGNSYSKSKPLVEKRSEETEKVFISNMTNIINLGNPFGFYWKVWERDQKVVANIFLRSELVKFTNGNCPVLVVSHLFFDQELTEDEKVGFYAEIIRSFWPYEGKKLEYPKCFLINIPCSQHESEIHKRLSFAAERKTYELLMLPLTKKGEKINDYKKFKEFLITYMR
ncbi:MAG: GNAT family N-acetyltransferase [Candidatus Helarchaeota archaeon]